ncbi:MAG: bifunctional sugar-1-phosphate nucleotidylyltransferase/acetyltransferase [Candidatus Saliniplasma sp.]
MKAVILAAGEGTRLRPFTVSEPKVMIPVANKPILEYVVEALVENGITEIVMLVGYKKEKILTYFGNGEEFNADIEYVVQKKQLGTAHALAQAEEKIHGDFIVLPGDNVISKETVAHLLKDKSTRSVLITESDTPSKYGVVSLSNGYVKEIIEKPEKSYSHLISTGIYSFPYEIFDRIRDFMSEQVYDLTSVVQNLENLKGIITEAMWIDAVYPWDLRSVNSTALTNVVDVKNGVIEENVSISGPVYIGEGTVIKSGTHIQGPAVIGSGSEIGPKACILPSTSIGKDSKIYPFALIQNSLLMNTVEVGPHSFIGNSVIGDGVRIGGNFTTYVGDADIKVSSGYNKVSDIGCMIAEDTDIGAGVVMEKGLIVGNDCIIDSGKTVRKNITQGSRVV